MSVSLERVRELLSYDAETGLLTWRVARPGTRAGTTAGLVRPTGYNKVSIDCRLYRVHRIAWLLSMGHWPKGDIDHIDGNRSNNKLANLRDACRAENMQNQRRARGNSKTGLIGVSANKDRWMARIKVDGKQRHLGTFDTPAEAHNAYLSAKRQLHTHNTL